MDGNTIADSGPVTPNPGVNWRGRTDVIELLTVKNCRNFLAKSRIKHYDVSDDETRPPRDTPKPWRFAATNFPASVVFAWRDEIFLFESTVTH
jgi:hypothetical protein